MTRNDPSHRVNSIAGLLLILTILWLLWTLQTEIANYPTPTPPPRGCGLTVPNGYPTLTTTNHC